jgi:hypothetical protein
MSVRPARAWLLSGVASAALVAGLLGATPAYAAKSFKGVDRPTVSGTRIVGNTLTAKRDTKTTPKASSVTYSWLRNGKPISKATKSTYKLTSSDGGKKISVKVCYKRKKYATKCVTSAAGTVAVAVTTQQQAVRMAQDYLKVLAFSRAGLIEQLVYEGFSTADATYGADHAGANWNAQAIRKAKDYLKSMAFSRAGLIEQLEFEGFTAQEAAYGADSAGANWMDQAVRKAQDYLKLMAFSRAGLISQLEYEGFTTEQATYAADAVGL